MNRQFFYDGQWLRHNRDKAISAVPFWHPLGFVNCTIQEEANISVRVHYWPKGDRRPKRPAWPIHTHTYTLESVVLDGEILDRQYAREIGAEFEEFAVEYLTGQSELHDCGRSTNVRCVAERRYFQGDKYIIAPDILHESIVPLGNEAITMVTCIGELRGSPIVLGRHHEAPLPYAVERFPQEIFWTRIYQALSV